MSKTEKIAVTFLLFSFFWIPIWREVNLEREATLSFYLFTSFILYLSIGGEREDDMFEDCREFAKVYCEKTGSSPTGRINREFILKMIDDESKELLVAGDEAEEVDALLDTVYYILDHLAKTGLDIRPIWKMIHAANMKKFGPGGYKREDGKWCKPLDFIPPDDDIRKEIQRQREIMKK